MYRSVRYTLIVAALLIIPMGAEAQNLASIAGVVRDASGAVLPGVTVEAASPALVEKQRVVVTDDTGQYRIEALRPGAYTVTFTLPGFSVVRRDGIELTGSFTATVNAQRARFQGSRPATRMSAGRIRTAVPRRLRSRSTAAARMTRSSCRTASR
jgi:hypothetical protein